MMERVQPNVLLTNDGLPFNADEIRNYGLSDRRKFERAPGCSEGVDRKMADQSVQMLDSLNESSIQLHPNLFAADM